MKSLFHLISNWWLSLKQARLDILKIHSRKMNLTRGINLRKIAEMMPGASGAEVKVGHTGGEIYMLYKQYSKMFNKTWIIFANSIRNVEQLFLKLFLHKEFIYCHANAAQSMQLIMVACYYATKSSTIESMDYSPYLHTHVTYVLT